MNLTPLQSLYSERKDVSQRQFYFIGLKSYLQTFHHSVKFAILKIDRSSILLEHFLAQ